MNTTTTTTTTLATPEGTEAVAKARAAYVAVTAAAAAEKARLADRPAMNSRTALSHTLGLDAGELSGYQYQPGVFPRAVYDLYPWWYCVGKRPPSPARMEHLAGLRWEPHPDQFWASRASTVIWRARQVPAPSA